MEQRNVKGTFLWDIRAFHDFQNIHTRNIWILMLYSAPYGQSDSTSRLWAMSKPGQFKTTRCVRALSLLNMAWLSWISELSGTPRSYASHFRNCALQRAPVRWTLASEPPIWRSLRPCQSRNITEQRIQRLQSRGELSRWRHAAEFPRRSTNWPCDTRNKELNSRGKRSQNIHPA